MEGILPAVEDFVLRGFKKQSPLPHIMIYSVFSKIKTFKRQQFWFFLNCLCFLISVLPDIWKQLVPLFPFLNCYFLWSHSVPQRWKFFGWHNRDKEVCIFFVKCHASLFFLSIHVLKWRLKYMISLFRASFF